MIHPMFNKAKYTMNLKVNKINKDFKKNIVFGVIDKSKVETYTK